jgi:hypothetical protein
VAEYFRLSGWIILRELATLGIPSVDTITTEAGIPAVDYIPAASVYNAISSKQTKNLIFFSLFYNKCDK